MAKVTRIAVCGKCGEGTTYLRTKVGKRYHVSAPLQCAGCGSESISTVTVRPALPIGTRLVPCPGHAHSAEAGGHVDNCSICAPRWGVVEERTDPVHA